MRKTLSKIAITTPGFEQIWEAANRVCDREGIGKPVPQDVRESEMRRMLQQFELDRRERSNG
jgi:hypothetical protein